MYVAGGGLYASEVRGWSTHDLLGFGWPVHEEVVGPNGVVCNSNAVVPANESVVVGCQVYPNGNISAGTYCSILWEYSQSGLFGNWIYTNMAENCVTVFA
jgi:hypothetical protein